MLEHASTGDVVVHLLEHGILDEADTLGRCLLTNAVVYGEYECLAHIDRECQVIGQGTEHRLFAADMSRLQSARDASGNREPCPSCWQLRVGDDRAPDYVGPYASADVVEHLSVSIEIDAFFAGQRRGWTHRAGVAAGAHRLLTHLLDDLPDLSETGLGGRALADVAELMAEQRRRLERWRRPLLDRVTTNGRWARRKPVCDTWVLLERLETRIGPTVLNEHVLAAVATADHLETIERSESKALLAHVCGAQAEPYFAIQPRSERAVDGSGEVLSRMRKLSGPDLSVTVETIHAALVLDPDSSPIDPDLLKATQHALATRT